MLARQGGVFLHRFSPDAAEPSLIFCQPPCVCVRACMRFFSPAPPGYLLQLLV